MLLLLWLGLRLWLRLRQGRLALEIGSVRRRSVDERARARSLRRRRRHLVGHGVLEMGDGEGAFVTEGLS